MGRGKRSPHLVAQFLRTSPGMQAAIIQHLADTHPDLINMVWTRDTDTTIYSGTWLLARAQSHAWTWTAETLRNTPIGGSLKTGISTWTRHA